MFVHNISPHGALDLRYVGFAIDPGLLLAMNRAAQRARVDRSALVREALREYLKRVKMRELEARDRAGYEKRPDDSAEAADWERVAAWPER